MLRILGVLSAILGLVLSTIGVLSGTVWKPDEYASVETQEITTSAVVLPYEVRDLLDSSVDVKISSSKQGKIKIVGAPIRDIQAWLGDGAYTLITGLETKKELSTSTFGKSKLPNKLDSDLWVVEQDVNNSTEITGASLAIFKNLAIMAISVDPKDAPSIALRWEQDATAPLMWPGIVAGIVLVIIGLLILFEDLQRRQRAKRREARRARRAARLQQLEAETAVIPKITDSDLELKSESNLSKMNREEANRGNSGSEAIPSVNSELEAKESVARGREEQQPLEINLHSAEEEER